MYGARWSKRLSWLLFDPTMTVAEIAEPYALHCRAEAARAMVGAPARAPTLVADGSAMRMRNYYAIGRGEYREIPLPAYFRSGAAASR